MCEKCNEIQLIKIFNSPQDYLACLSYIKKLVSSGDFSMVLKTCDFDDVKDDTGKWIDDIIEHIISCKKCGKQFRCVVDTYHGGGSFKLVD